MQSTRERTSALLQDKDAEISRLKEELFSSNRVVTRVSTSQYSNSLVPPVSDDNQSGNVLCVYSVYIVHVCMM